ncbi:hypothetical protein pdul_cds_287 [Pandoravirus dulcis]|uniref:Uncharacterized protein n=1 Tax=Pandoravirus dulcis TaxID=1349409 RepID=S4VWF5_9VIRU|nr:hypothetical protein pdul_cds_287 [Pandoravirus dulcis]AGO82269.2 hypothetical protein pdul_cds_287 [Pandoravirus dulcis]
MSRQSPFNAGFGAQGMARPATTGRAVFARGLQPNLPGVRSQLGPQGPIDPFSSANLSRDADQIEDFFGLIQESDAAAGPLGAGSRMTRAQQAAVQQAANSRSQFNVGSEALRGGRWGAFVGQQTGAGPMEIAPRSRAGSRAGSLRQQPVDVTGLAGAAGGLLGQGGAGQVDMDLAAFGQPQQQAGFGAQGQFVPTPLETLQQQRQALLQQQLGAGAATAPAALGGAVQGLGTAAPFAARYRTNSFDGSAGQAYGAGYGRNGRRNSVGFGRQDAALNPFASQSFAGQYGGNQGAAANGFARQYAGNNYNDNGGARGINNFAHQYGGNQAARNFAGRYGNYNDNGGAQGINNFAGQYAGNQAARRNFAGQYGANRNNGFGGMGNGSNNYAGQYGNNNNGVSRQRRASLGVGNGYF